MLTRLTFLTALSSALMLLASPAPAQDVRVYRPAEAVDPHDVARILGQPPTRLPMGKSRSIRLLDPASESQAPDAVGQPGAHAVTHPVADAGRSITALALPVQFAFDSADILPDARGQLDALAEGIRLLPSKQAVVIEGHTDAVGSDQYNEYLSQKRASAVKRYLVTTHGIEPTRLRAMGLGETALLTNRPATAPEQRRVQFRGE